MIRFGHAPDGCGLRVVGFGSKRRGWRIYPLRPILWGAISWRVSPFSEPVE